MALPGIVDESELKLLLKKLLANQGEVLKFAIVARGPKEGELILSKKEKLKKKEVQAEAEAEAKKNSGGKPVKVDVITGECSLHKPGGTTLRLVVYGKAVAKAVACAEHLVARGPYKTVGFTEVILEEIEEPVDTPSVSGSWTAETPPTTAPDTTTAAPDAAGQFAQRLTGLMPSIKAAAGTPAGDEAKLRASEAGVFARKADFARANQLLDQVEAALKTASEQRAFVEQREKLAPLLAKVQKEQPDKAAALQKVWDFAETQFQAGKIAGASKALEGFAASLASDNTANASTKSGDEQAQLFARRRDQLEPDLLSARKADPDKASKLLQVWEFAEAKADAGDFPTALKALDGLEATLKKVLAEAPKTDAERFGIGEGIVAERRKELADFFQQRVEKAKKQTDADVKNLTKVLEEHLNNPQDLTAAINKELHRIYDEFAQRINKAIDTGAKDEVVDVLDRCRKELAANKLIDRLGDTSSELGVDVGVVQEIGDLFNDAEDKVATVLS